MRNVAVAKQIVGVLVVVMAVAGYAVAQDQKTGQPKMTPEQQAEMEAWQKVATPGGPHHLLQPVIGSWNAVTTNWEKPGGPSQQGKGTAEQSWVLGGRFIKQEFHGEFMGMPFEGIGYTGYDNFKKQYIGSWMDNMGTMMMISTGDADAGGKVFTFQSGMDDIMTGKPIKMREVLRIVDNNKHVYEMYTADRTSGVEFKMMEIVYTRK
jgi:hypothetical protein